MKYLIILSLFVINSANAIDYEKVMQESKALNKKYCDLKVKIACTQLLCEEDPGKCPEVSEIPDPKFSQSQKEE